MDCNDFLSTFMNDMVDENSDIVKNEADIKTESIESSEVSMPKKPKKKYKKKSEVQKESQHPEACLSGKQSQVLRKHNSEYIQKLNGNTTQKKANTVVINFLYFFQNVASVIKASKMPV